jgi:phosphatidylserine/phosphatidylglycerophosphate/cardiolipin synthase-like enzyme
VTRRLPGLGHLELERLASALASGRLGLRVSPPLVERFVGRDAAAAVVAELARLADTGVTEAGAAFVLEALAAERVHQRELVERVELVWTDPEQSNARDTAVIVRELLGRAKVDLLLANYAFDQPKRDEARAQARTLWEPLARNMDQTPGLRVRMFVHVDRKYEDTTSRNETLLDRFRENFRQLWPGERRPEIYYDPRSLLTKDDLQERASMHAKCIVVDGHEVLVTSANFTQAAQERNVEVGLRLRRDEGIARRIVGQFERLVEAGRMVVLG